MRLFCHALAALAIAATGGASVAGAETGLQLSAGVNYSSGDFGGQSDTDVIVAPFAARLTVGNWAFRASVPFVSVDGPANVTVILDDSGGGRGSSGPGGGSGRNRPEDDGVVGGAGVLTRSARQSGIGDVSLSATYAFNNVAGSGLYTDLSGRVRLPTGDEDKGLGAGATDYGLSAELGAELSRGGVYALAGRRFLGDVDGLNREDGWQAGAGAWLDLTEKTSLGAGYDWRQSSTSGGEDPSEMSGYVTYQLTQVVRVGLNASAGLNDASPDYGVGVNLVLRPKDRRN